jgi:hypothetical protein
VSIEWVGTSRIGANWRSTGDQRSVPLVAAALLLTAVLVALPAALGPVRLNDSFWIDLVWLEQFARELAHGTLYPRWLPLSHDGLGSPVFYFYPPLAFYGASAFALAGLGTYQALIAAFCAANLLSGIGVYLWLKDQSRVPLAGALLFMIAPYHLFNFYLRGNIAEFLATAILPFVLWGIRQAVDRRPHALVWTAIAYAALAMSHLPLALLASLFLFAPYALVSTRCSGPDLLRITAALAMGTALAAIYLVPAFALERYRSSADLWSLPYLQPWNWTVWSRHSWQSGTFTAIAIVAGGLSVGTAALLIRVRSGWAIWALVCTALAVGVVPFIWSLPLLRTVQFPFRLLPIAELALVTAIARSPRAKVPWLVLTVLFLALARLITTAQPESPKFGDEVIRAVHPDVPENLPPGERPYSWPSKWALQVARTHRAPQFHGKTTIDPLFYFPAWQVRCEGQTVPSFPAPETELLAYNGRGCTRTLVWTAAEKVGTAISLLALLALVSCWLSPWLFARRRWSRRESLPRST